MKTGFTLIELLVVVAIVGILSAVGVVAFNNFQTTTKEKACFQNFEDLKKMIDSNYALCKLKGANEKITIKTQYLNNTPGRDRQLNCSYNFGTIAGETAKSFGNYAKSPYENLHYNIPILSYIGDPPKDGGLAYYPERAGFMLRVKCNGRVKRFQWNKN